MKRKVTCPSCNKSFWLEYENDYEGRDPYPFYLCDECEEVKVKDWIGPIIWTLKPQYKALEWKDFKNANHDDIFILPVKEVDAIKQLALSKKEWIDLANFVNNFNG